MKNKKKLEMQSKELADMTFKLQKICQEKESFFAQQFNLTSMEFRCLKYLANKCYLSIKELASNMSLTPSRLTYIITSLEKKNLIEREMYHNDRRNIKLKLKEESIEFVNEIEKKHIQLHESIFKNISSEDRSTILESLVIMYNSLKEWTENNTTKK